MPLLGQRELVGGRNGDSLDAAPEQLRAVITRATAPTPDERFPDAGSMLSQVSRYLRDLSMGTTQDFGVAAEEGATYVRVGSMLFHG